MPGSPGFPFRGLALPAINRVVRQNRIERVDIPSVINQPLHRAVGGGRIKLAIRPIEKFAELIGRVARHKVKIPGPLVDLSQKFGAFFEFLALVNGLQSAFVQQRIKRPTMQIILRRFIHDTISLRQNPGNPNFLIEIIAVAPMKTRSHGLVEFLLEFAVRIGVSAGLILSVAAGQRRGMVIAAFFETSRIRLDSRPDTRSITGSGRSRRNITGHRSVITSIDTGISGRIPCLFAVSIDTGTRTRKQDIIITIIAQGEAFRGIYTGVIISFACGRAPAASRGLVFAGSRIRTSCSGGKTITATPSVLSASGNTTTNTGRVRRACRTAGTHWTRWNNRWTGITGYCRTLGITRRRAIALTNLAGINPGVASSRGDYAGVLPLLGTDAHLIRTIAGTAGERSILIPIPTGRGRIGAQGRIIRDDRLFSRAGPGRGT